MATSSAPPRIGRTVHADRPGWRAFQLNSDERAPALVGAATKPPARDRHAAHARWVRSENDVVFCNFPGSSRSAVDENIVYRSPDATDAVAWWRSAAAHHDLCLRDPRSKRLAKPRATGRIARTTTAHPAAPMAMRLGIGVICTVRVGGSGAELKGRPTWAAY